jgi:Zn-dependent protease with chaperone function
MNRSVALVIVALVAGCSTNPYTGRSQLMLVSEAQEKELGVSAYQEVLGQSQVSTDPREVDPVRRVGKAIAQAANQPDFKWEFNTIVDDKTMNAWCLPGGKIAFYTGIFPALEDEAGMAFVMGHEVGHALMHHGAERMSQQLAAGGATALVGAYLGMKDSDSAGMIMAAFGVATQVGVLLPFSRKHEAEADQVGLALMAKAGYDPHAAVRVWKKMSQLGGKQPPEWLSTHPSHESRIADLESRMSEAVAVYEKSQPAAVAKLPPIEQRPGKKPADSTGSALAAGPGAPVHVQVGPAKLATLKDERKVVQFEVEFDRDVFVDSVEITGPKIGRKTVAVKSGVKGGVTKILTLPQEFAVSPKPEPGEYTLTFRGMSSGTPFNASSGAAVR